MPRIELSDLAAAIADGTPIDWAGLDWGKDPSDLRVRARIVERIAHLHAALPPAASFSSSLHKSLLNLSDEDIVTAETPVTWGPLTIVEKIGRGTYGDVFRAHDPRLKRDVALKLLRRRDRRESAVIEEGHLMARVRHPNVVTVYGAERIDGRVGLWMEFVDGQTLEGELAARGRPFEVDDIVRIGIDLCGAVAAVHDAGLLHRDLKAQNVMRDQSGRVVVTDFGAGRELSDNGHCAGGELAGTPLYLAPEVLDGQPASPQSDIYSLGVLLYRLATGSYPVGGRSIADLREAYARGDRRVLSDSGSGLRADLGRIIDRALAPNPADRYASASDMEGALAAFLQPSHNRAEPVEPLPTRFSRWVLATGIVAATGLLAALAVWTWGSSPKSPVIPFEARDWVLVTPFENRTGDPTLDGILEHALERELLNSSFVNVAPRERVIDALVLMQKPSDTRLDGTVGREVALRDGGIRALVTGRVETIGETFVLTAGIVRPADSSMATTISEEARSRQELLPAMRRLSLRMREALGEAFASIETSREALAKVTTPSLRALQLYSRAALRARSGDARRDPAANRAATEQLLREAIREDPAFASAHILLATVASITRPWAEAEVLAHAERARAETDQVTRGERLFISGKYHELRASRDTDPAVRSSNLQEAGAAYEALLRLQPDNAEALAALGVVYTRLGNHVQAGRTRVRLAAVRPNSASIHADAAMAMLRAGDVAEARRLARHALAVATAVPDEAAQWAIAWAKVFPAYEAWLQYDVRSALRMIDELGAGMESLPPSDRPTVPVADMYLTLGRLDQAEQAARLTGDRERRIIAEAIVTGERGDPAALRASLTGRWFDPQTIGQPWFLAAVDLSIDAGLVGIARAALEKTDGANRESLEGQLALAEGRINDAIARLEHAALLLDPGYSRWLRMSRMLANAWHARANLPRAIQVLERASQQPRLETGLAPVEWIKMRARLAELYRDAGRVGEAELIEAELRKLLVVADDDHPLKVRLRSLER